MNNKKRARIVVVGGGAGGLELATRLGRRLGRRGLAEVRLVDSNLRHVWKPLLHEVAVGTLDSNGNALEYLPQARRHHFHFTYGRLIGLNRTRKRIQLAPMFRDGEEVVPGRNVPYDILVLAVGSRSNDFGTPGVAEHCHFLDTTEQAERFQQTLVQQILRAQTGVAGHGGMDVVIVGGGATGVELAAELRSAARQAAHYGLDKLDPERDLRISLLEAGPRLLGPLSERLAKQTEQQLKDLGVSIYTGQMVTEVTADHVKTRDGLCLPASLKVWAAGVKAPDFLRELDGLETARDNRIMVRPTLQTTIDDDVYALGDCAWCPQPDSEAPVPPRAQAASQQATYLAKALERRLSGREVDSFQYHDRGSLISLSRGGAVGNLMGNLLGTVTIQGYLALWAYRMLYRRHQAVLYGRLRTGLLAIGERMVRPVRPRLKLH